MASEKGATYLDKLCHKFYDHPKGHGEKTDYVCRICGGPLETCYCEERLYLVQCTDCGTLALVKTANPKAAAGVTLARPTLTPPNEPLTQADLDSMDYDKVWIDYEDDCGEWALVCNGYIYSIDTLEGAGLDFGDYMRGERLEPHGYKVYRRPPEGEANE